MKALPMIIALLAGSVWLPQVVADSAIASGIKAEKSSQPMKMPMYKPPRRGAPTITVGGGTRGVTGKIPTVYVLAPNHVGLTTSAQPTLNWYLSDPGSKQFEFLLIDEEGIDPLLELTLDSSKIKPGIQTINLSEHNVVLKPGVSYTWSVVMISDQTNRSNDIVTSGFIEHQTLDTSIKQRLTKASTKEDVFIFAQEGYWYDAVNSLSTLIEKNPQNDLFKQQRAELLKQVGLLELANQ